ncbi:MAG: DUF456 domain-containing protein [Phycisphaeraceae bacterium]|nr:DUF456 domain-containing protein [Phycisphaeraceae bacterium]
MELVITIALAALFLLVGTAGIALALIGLPGTWMILLVGVLVEFVRPETFSWWTIGVGGLLAIGAEIAEFSAGAVGAKKAGGSRRAIWMAVAGGLVGGIAGTFVIPIPIVGTIAGAAIGSGACAMLAEMTVEGRTLAQAGKVGGGAAIGRTLASVFKAGFALALTVLLTIAAVIP